MYARGRRITKRRLLGVLLLVAVVAGGVAAAMFLPDALAVGIRGIRQPHPRPRSLRARRPVSPAATPNSVPSRGWTEGRSTWWTWTRARNEPWSQREPTRWSGSATTATWVAFGDGAIVPSGGGDVQNPVGKLSTWQWSPTDDVLAGVTANGGVVVGGPDDERRVLVKDGSGATHVLFSPNGRSLEADLGGDRVAIIDVVDGATTIVYRVSPGDEGAAAGRGVVAGRAMGVVLLEVRRDGRGCRSTPFPPTAATG